MPMTEMGLQVTPTSPVTSPTSMPKSPRSAAMGAEHAVPTLWQHWMGPVLHWLEGPESPPVRRAGTSMAVAAARVETATAVKAPSLNCMLVMIICLNECGGLFE
jgi:hypothetical protein